MRSSCPRGLVSPLVTLPREPDEAGGPPSIKFYELRDNLLASGAQPHRGLYFPFGQDQASYEAQRDAKTKGVPEGALAALDALQPYRGGNDWLWSLHQLDIIDKHRLLLTIIVSHNSVVIDMGAIMRHLAPADSPGAEAPSMPIALAPSDSELAGPQPLVFTAPIGDVSHDHVRIVTQVALGDPEQLRGQPLRPSLWAMHAQVVHAIESFRPFL